MAVVTVALDLVRLVVRATNLVATGGQSISRFLLAGVVRCENDCETGEVFFELAFDEPAFEKLAVAVVSVVFAEEPLEVNELVSKCSG